MKKILAMIMVVCMVAALLPAVAAAAGDEAPERESILVNFAYRENGEPSVAINHEKQAIKPAAISGDNFVSVAAETSNDGAASTQTRNNALSALNHPDVKMLQVVVHPVIWNNKAYVDRYTPNVAGRWTIEVDAKTTTAGWYDLTIRGTDNYIGGVWGVWVDHAYVGEYNCRSNNEIGYGTHLVSNLGKVYISPDANGKFKVSFVLKGRGYSSTTGEASHPNETRIILEDMTFAPCDAPEPAEPKTISTELSWDTAWFADKSVDYSTWQTHGFEMVAEKCENTTSIGSRYTAISLDNQKFFLQFNIKNVFPENRNRNMTVKVKIPQAGYYYPELSGILNKNASYASIYVNGEYVGDYDYYMAQTGFGQGELKKLNAVYLPAGEAEISFCIRTKYSSSNGLLIPYMMNFVPADEPTVSEIEGETPESLELGEKKDLEVKVKMNDTSYRNFGYRMDAGMVYAKNTVKVESSNPEVVEVSNVNCVDAIASTLGGKATPETVNYSLTAKSAGKADITLSAVIGTKTFKKVYKVTVPANIPGEEISGNVSVYIDALSGGKVEKSTSSTIASVAPGENVTAKAVADEGYVFSHWKDASGKFVSSDAEYSFKPYVNTSAIAVFDKTAVAEGEEKEVLFFNGNGDYVAKRTTSGTSISDIPEVSLAGYVFDMWTTDGKTEFDGNNIVKAITRVVAQYEKTGKTYGGSVTCGSESHNVVYDKEVSFSDATAKAWKRNGKTIAYGTTYNHYIFDAAEITPITEDVEKVPVIALDKHSDEDVYMIEYDVPEGFTKLEAGILFGDEAHKTVNGCYYKAKSVNKEENTTHGQFTAMKSDSGTYDQSVVRGYLIYTDGTVINIVYAD